MAWQVLVKAPRRHTKAVKLALEQAGLFDKSRKITVDVENESLMSIPTRAASASKSREEASQTATELLHSLQDPTARLCWAADPLSIHIQERDVSTVSYTTNALQAALLDACTSLTEYAPGQQGSRGSIFMRLGKRYCIYHPMLLLSAGHDTADAMHELQELLSQYNVPNDTFWAQVSNRMAVTHVALNAPVPAQLQDNHHSSNQPDTSLQIGQTSTENQIRSPTNLLPVHGPFPVVLPPFPHHTPSADDLSAALWVHTIQNDIHQTWAPAYTMFSAGNVTEKARLLTLPSVLSAIRTGKSTEMGCTAVDLFAGIGYFAFSYLKAGISHVLCWDLNPWSIEGLSRGARANGWTAAVFPSECPASPSVIRGARITAFNESNTHAPARLAQLAALDVSLAPIRHVNAGMLPSSAQAHRTAVEIIDATLGGWVHLHESVRVSEVEDRVAEIMGCIHECVLSRGMTRNEGTGGSVQSESGAVLDHVEKVKSVGKGVVHIVLDVWIPPLSWTDDSPNFVAPHEIS